MMSLFQVFNREMSIYHRCLEFYMAEKFLDMPDWRSVLQQDRGEGVAERVRRDLLLDTRLLEIFLNIRVGNLA